MASIDNSTLRPLTLGQILDRTMRLYRQQFLTFVGIIAVMLVPVTAVQIILTLVNVPSLFEAMEQIQDPSIAGDPMAMFASQMAASGIGTNLLFVALSFILVQGIATAALVHAIGNSYLGRPVDILSSYGQLSGSWLRLLGALILWAILYFGILIFTLVPCVGWLMGPGVIVFFVYVIQPLIPATVVIEGQGGLDAIRRVWDLARRRFWWTLGFMIVLGIFAYILLIGPAALANWLLTLGLDTILPDADPVTLYGVQTGISQLVTMLMQLLYLPIQLTAVTLMYFDLRVRTEGFDLAMMATSDRVETETEGETSPVMPPAPAPASDGLITGTEAAYFFGISIGAGAFCVALYAIFFLIVLAIMAPTLGAMP
jgi:hypothetical protein